MNSYFYKKLATALVAVTAFATAANAECERYKDCSFAVDTTRDVVYAENVPHLSEPHNLSVIAKSFDSDIAFFKNEESTADIDLKMDIYRPKGDVETKRAAVIVAHGGAFVAGAKNDFDQKSVAYCGKLAKLGYVAASIQYRLGVVVQDLGESKIPADISELATQLLIGATYEMKINADDYARAVYRGVQDINAAVRYIRKNAASLGVDPDRIYVLGNSAGAIMSVENIYTDKQEDFPSYINKTDAYELGGLNEFGVQNVNAHANGAVALWGATHDLATIGHNKTPIFLAHGTADETVLYENGKPMQNFSVESLIPKDLDFEALIVAADPSYASLAPYIAPNLEKAIKNNIKLTIDAPELYGSYVIDTALTAHNGTKAKPETYFVENAKHEFYNHGYETEVQTKVFDFLYKLATSDKVVKALAGVTVTKDADDNLMATFDGSYDGTDALDIKENIEVASVSFDREFATGVFSTLTLPFSVHTDNLSGLMTVLKFNGLKEKDGKTVVSMKKVFDKEDSKYASATIEAYKPYMMMMESGKLSVSGPVTLEKNKTTADEMGGWAFKGTLGFKKWESGNSELGRIYGFAAEAQDGISVGQFVKAGAGAWISPFRAYLEAPETAKGIKGNYPGAKSISTMQLPENLDIIIDDDDETEEKTTVIGQFNTRTGEIRMNTSRGVYDLKGRSVGNKANKARGAYYGKVIK